MPNQLSPSELVLNPDGSLYHCNLKPEHIADTIFLVGDPQRVPKVSAHFDKILFTTQKREIVTHVGIKRGQHVAVTSTGMGTDNIDIVLNELDAAANIDLESRSVKPHKRVLTFIRLGTSGALQPDIPVDSFLASSDGLGFDGLLHFYEGTARYTQNKFIDAFIAHTQWQPALARPYWAPADPLLLHTAKSIDMLTGITATATGFYGPQGRVLRLPVNDALLNEKLSSFRYQDLRITNFEMETSALYGLSALMGHRALAINCIIANRFTGQFSKDYQRSVAEMIRIAVEFIL
ncbi:MAG: nucleoside phosphorylase [Saprospiraceae bacterium]